MLGSFLAPASAAGEIVMMMKRDLPNECVEGTPSIYVCAYFHSLSPIQPELSRQDWGWTNRKTQVPVLIGSPCQGSHPISVKKAVVTGALVADLGTFFQVPLV